MELKLIRNTLTEDFIRGFIRIPSGVIINTLELPYRDNKENVSCIPIGNYECSKILSPKFGETFEITNVIQRTHILFHSGNTAQDTHGCILLGMRTAKLGLLESKRAMTIFLDELKDCKNFMLSIAYR
jgi:hypothetical protein